MSDKISEKIKRLHADAEVQWGKYEHSVCHEIQRAIEHDGIYDSHNFYEFCKGYVFARLNADKKLQAAEEREKILREAVEQIAKKPQLSGDATTEVTIAVQLTEARGIARQALEKARKVSDDFKTRMPIL